MSLILKTDAKTGRTMYVYYPSFPKHNPYLDSLLTIFREDAEEASAAELLDRGFRKLAEEKRMVIAFPNPTEEGWNITLDPKKADDVAQVDSFLRGITRDTDEPMEVNWNGIPTLKSMLSVWHLMNDFRYVLGIGTGASMAYAYAVNRPDNVAAVVGFGGGLTIPAAEKAQNVPVTAVLSGATTFTGLYFRQLNRATEIRRQHAGLTEYVNALNPAQYVVEVTNLSELNEVRIEALWRNTFSVCRRYNTGMHGDLGVRSDLSGASFTWYLEDGSLDGKPHTWLVHVPSELPSGKVPLLVFMHGGSDSPAEAAEMSKFHELGEKEGFITVYPWGSNRAGWNSDFEPTGENDVDYICSLIDFMGEKYPVDLQRVYLSGFSNGAGMAQAVAMMHPEKVAALCHIDSNWPGKRSEPSTVDYEKLPCTARALELKKEFDWRMPVWYTYGTREASFPVYNDCTQQHQYDFWKIFNNIEVKPTPPREDPDPSGVGVKGDEEVFLAPSEIYPYHVYQVEKFYTKDAEPKNYYNLAMLHDKGHEVAPMDAALGWNYVKQFKRNPDGTVGLV